MYFITLPYIQYVQGMVLLRLNTYYNYIYIIIICTYKYMDACVEYMQTGFFNFLNHLCTTETKLLFKTMEKVFFCFYFSVPAWFFFIHFYLLYSVCFLYHLHRIFFIFSFRFFAFLFLRLCWFCYLSALRLGLVNRQNEIEKIINKHNVHCVYTKCYYILFFFKIQIKMKIKQNRNEWRKKNYLLFLF